MGENKKSSTGEDQKAKGAKFLMAQTESADKKSLVIAASHCQA